VWDSSDIESNLKYLGVNYGVISERGGVSEPRGGWRYGYLETLSELLNLCFKNMAQNEGTAQKYGSKEAPLFLVRRIVRIS
jgi:hypothetical protein